MWHGEVGVSQGTFDFLTGTCYDIGTLCFQVGMDDMDFSHSEREAISDRYYEMSANFMTSVDSGIQSFLQIDPNNPYYQNFRWGTSTALGIGSVVLGGYGLAKGALKVGGKFTRMSLKGAQSSLKGIGNAAAKEGLALSRGAENVNAAEALRSKLSGLKKAQNTSVQTRVLPDGRLRYYRAETAASSLGPTRGGTNVVEWNPKTGNVRGWYECYDHSGNVNRIHPKSINGQKVSSQHYPPIAQEFP